MGGFGSGNHYRWQTRGTTEEHRQIDIRRWRREGLLVPGTAFSWAWWRDGARAAAIDVGVARLAAGGEVPSAVVLDYRCRYDGGAWANVREAVALDWTTPNYGGRRPWFLCPGRAGGVPCGRRVALLYLGARHFRCRHCLDLAYASTREDAADRVVRRLVALRERLGGPLGLALPFPARPQGMHHRTYHRLFMQGYRLGSIHHAHFEARLARLTAALDAREARREQARQRYAALAHLARD